MCAHAAKMAATRFWERRSARRIAVVNAFEVPSSVRQRFTFQHGDLTAGDVRTVEAAAQQWFRLAARHPGAKLSMPSVVVDELWHELVLHTREYAEFCEAAFGQFLHHEPESAMGPAAVAANRSTALLTTFRLARQDEDGGPDSLPLLFRVDEDLTAVGGRRYLADCGGRGQCYEVRSTVCLQHLTSVGKPIRGNWGGNIPRPPQDVGNGGQGCGGGGG
jgi:hypothetical protein